MNIALTGGPSAGKTAMMETFALHRASQLSFAQEAASLIFRGGFPRGVRAVERKCQERAIYYLQRELERLAALNFPNRPVLCDRGSLDCLAYWPGSEDEFFTETGSSIAKELSRYQCVIHLEPAPPFDIPFGSLRIENEEEVFLINGRIKSAWSLHPNRIIVSNEANFLKKVEAVTVIIDQEIEKSRRHVHEFTRMA